MYYEIFYGFIICLSLGLSCGFSSAYLISRRLSLLGDIMSHASLLGITFAFLFFGKNIYMLMLFSALSSLLSAFFIFFIKKYITIPKDTSLSIVLSLFFSLGIILIGVIQKKGLSGQNIINNFIFGNMFSVSQAEIKFLSMVCLAVSLFFILTVNIQKYIAFDHLFFKLNARGSLFFELLFLLCISLIIVCGIQVVGILLMSALIIVPGAISKLFAKSYVQLQLYSVFFGLFSTVFGFYISTVYTHFPPGPVMIMMATSLCFLFVYIIRKIKKI